MCQEEAFDCDSVYVYRTQLDCKRCNNPFVLIAIVYENCFVTDGLCESIVEIVNKEHRRNHGNNMFVVNVSRANPERN